jgi:hypothetical protein
MFDKNGGVDAKTYEYRVNPYKFARCSFSMYVDPQIIVSRSLGTDTLRKERTMNMLLNPAVLPYINMPEVIQEFMLKDYDSGQPEKFMKSPEQQQLDQHELQ